MLWHRGWEGGGIWNEQSGGLIEETERKEKMRTRKDMRSDGVCSRIVFVALLGFAGPLFLLVWDGSCGRGRYVL